MGSPRLLIDALRTYAADREDRLTEVFASTLAVNPELCTLIAQKAGVRGKVSRWATETQWQDRLVDLVLWGFDERERCAITVFVENKYNPTERLHTHWFDPQQTRNQLAALQGQEGQCRLVGIASRVDTARLDGPPDLRPYDPRSDGCDLLLSWDEIKDLSFEAGNSPGWPSIGRTERATAGQRLLLEFIRYVDLEENVLGALDEEDVFVFARTARAEERTDRLLALAAEQVAAIFATDVSDDDYEDDDYAENGSRRTWVSIPAPPGSWLASLRHGSLTLLISGAPYDDDHSVAEPQVYAGATWNAGKDGRELIRDSAWEAAVDSANLGPVWDSDYCNVFAAMPLLRISAAGDALTDQAKFLADWAETSMRAALALPAPPNPDRAKQPTRRRK